MPIPSIKSWRRCFTTRGIHGYLWGVLALLCLQTSPAHALVRFDFEQLYFQHPGRQVWDFSMVRPDSVYHIFYHTINNATPTAASADTIWHATSPDLRHWQIEGPVLISGQGTWDEAAIWAPEIFRDEVGNRWAMAYTGIDLSMNQRICMAFSDDLDTWTKSPANPIAVPDTALYMWSPDNTWSDFRDPFIYRENDQWHLLATAKQWLVSGTGVIYHAVSDDLETWTDVGPLFIHDGVEKWRVMESPQYKTIAWYHHLLFGEFDTNGVTILSSPSPLGWSMSKRVLLDYGYAPELDEFDAGVNIFSRIAPFTLPQSSDLTYVVRFDTLVTNLDGSNPKVVRANPLDSQWATHTGTANLGNPIFGDNPLWRGQPSVGLVGHGYYSSKEYYHGPLSGRGAPGTQLGDGVTGDLISHPFVVQGNRMTLLVGGGNYPQTCYVALVDEADSTILYAETGADEELMTLREWDLTPYQGRTCTIHIVDAQTANFGHINVDEIIEIFDVTPPAPPTAVAAYYMPTGVNLDWDDAQEEDFLTHRIYRDSDPDFVPTPANLIQETALSVWLDPTEAPWDFHYKVTTLDTSGNESPPGIPSGLSAAPEAIPHRGTTLGTAVPNPFNPSTRISFTLGGPGRAALRIYDLSGRLVDTLVEGWLPAGPHAAVWDGHDRDGRPAATGVYLFRLTAGNYQETRRMTLIK